MYDVSRMHGLSDVEQIYIMADYNVSGINWDCIKQEITIRMKGSGELIPLQKYRNDKIVNEIFEKIEGE
jgi:hypothetical protein